MNSNNRIIKYNNFNSNYCVSCGAEIPEGQMICFTCDKYNQQDNKIFLEHLAILPSRKDKNNGHQRTQKKS